MRNGFGFSPQAFGGGFSNGFNNGFGAPAAQQSSFGGRPRAPMARVSFLQKDCIEIFAEDCKDCIEILRREIFCSFSFVLRSNLTLNASEH